MPTIDLYSRRKQLAEKGEPDVFVYDRVPNQLRAQVQHIWDDALGRYWGSRSVGYASSVPDNNDGAWDFIRDQLCREHGRLSLASQSESRADLVGFLHSEESVDRWLDAIELSFLYMETTISRLTDFQRQKRTIQLEPAGAIDELNTRFRQAAFGYRYESGHIIRIDSEFVHAEIIKPALVFLADARFAGPREEFLSAHAHYRAGEHRDAIIDANNAFESTMKTICDLKGWAYPNGVRASDLLKVVRDKGLLPTYLDASFDQLAATLKSGLPKVRNEEGSHGQGAQPKETPGYVASYALQLAATNILFLVEAFKTSSKR